MAGTDVIYSKIFNDPIHGHIELHPACIAIIDTPQFQRLRFIKQLGLCYYVFPGGCHNRFEHSIGVCHLAGELVKTIQRRQPELSVSDKDVLCVEIAGLCHDLGHGPFSHMFDSKFIPAVDPDTTWKHEKASQEMFDYLIACNKLMDQDCGSLRQYGIEDQDIVFIKELIDRPHSVTAEVWPYEGRPREKGFLYEVVSNKRNGIDVDKWDYFARDSYHLGISNSFDYNRFIKFSRVLKEGNQWQICVRDKEIRNIYHMFYTRYMLHKAAYQHPVICAVEEMMTEAMIKANDHIKIGKNKVPMSDCIYNMEDFMMLTDNIMFKILESEDEALRESREIVQRLFSRNLYKCITTSPALPPAKGEFKDKAIKEELLTILNKNTSNVVSRDHFIIVISQWDFGMRDQNPIERLRVYNKASPNVAVKPSSEDIGILQPMCFKEIQIRVYCRTKDSGVCEQIKEAFEEWMKTQIPS